jgi:hypothetical protein
MVSLYSVPDCKVLLGRRKAGLAEALADELVRVEIDLPVMGVVAERPHGPHRAGEVELQGLSATGSPHCDRPRD